MPKESVLFYPENYGRPYLILLLITIYYRKIRCALHLIFKSIENQMFQARLFINYIPYFSSICDSICQGFDAYYSDVATEYCWVTLGVKSEWGGINQMRS